GRFVVTELRDRGFVPLLLGRDAGKLQALAAFYPGLEYRAAAGDEPAALRTGIRYVDVAAEIEANLDTFKHFTDRAQTARVAVVPAMAFFGGLGDLLVTTAMGEWTAADEAHVAYGLSGWRPTPGTLAS